MRIRRLAEDRITSVATPLRRYRCADAHCGWEDAIAVTLDASRRRRARRDARRKARQPRRMAIGASLAAGLLVALAGSQAWQLYRSALPDPVLERVAARIPLVPFGQSHEGEPLPGGHPLLVRVADARSADAGNAMASDAAGDALARNVATKAVVEAAAGATAAGAAPSGTGKSGTGTTGAPATGGSGTAATATAAAERDPPLAFRQNCAWGEPGRNPYRGTVEQALEGARLPPEIAERLAAMIRAGQATDRLEITTASIRTVHQYREYDPSSIADGGPPV